MKIFPVLNINDFDFEGDTNQFYANQFSNHLYDFHKSITKPHKHDFFLSVLFTHGHGTHDIDFNTYDIKPGSLFFMLPGQTHDWTLSDDIEGYIFFHIDQVLRVLFILQEVSPDSPLPSLSPRKTGRIFGSGSPNLCSYYPPSKDRQKNFGFHMAPKTDIKYSNFSYEI